MHALQPIAACTCPPVQHHYSGRFWICGQLQILDSKLSFQTYIKHLQSKVKTRIGFLFRKQIILHSCCQTYPRKTDYPTDPRLQRCHSLSYSIHISLACDIIYAAPYKTFLYSPHCAVLTWTGRWHTGPLWAHFVIKVWHSLDLWCFLDNWKLGKRSNHDDVSDLQVIALERGPTYNSELNVCS
jgi:hypothetical protein